MILKKIAGIAFIVSFLMAIRVFTGNGGQYISYPVAKYIFLVSGAIALLLNLLSFQYGKGSQMFNLFYWIGSVLLFMGLAFKILHFPYVFPIIIAGLIFFSISFIVPSINKEDNSPSDLLDD
tara:strand:- start:7631 stop:7996 length:366 start_codon:yes stop_codon:yes gene_type:complete